MISVFLDRHNQGILFSGLGKVYSHTQHWVNNGVKRCFNKAGELYPVYVQLDETKRAGKKLNYSSWSQALYELSATHCKTSVIYITSMVWKEQKYVRSIVQQTNYTSVDWKDLRNVQPRIVRFLDNILLRHRLNQAKQCK